jgi:NitT/TauT family transport system permease protein
VRHPNYRGWLVAGVAVALAEVCVRGFELQGSVAAPSAAFRALVAELASGAMSRDLVSTLVSFAGGLAIAILVGVTAGVAIGSSRTLLAAFSPLVEFLRPIPAVALIPLAILVFGFDESMRWFVIAYAAVWPILINTLYGVRSSDRLLHDIASTSGLSRFDRLIRVTLPSAMPSIATGIRVSASIALLVGVTAEFYVGTGGIGSYMYQQQSTLHLPELYAAVILVGVIGYAINVGLRAAQRRAVFWVGEERVTT